MNHEKQPNTDDLPTIKAVLQDPAASFGSKPPSIRLCLVIL